MEARWSEHLYGFVSKSRVPHVVGRQLAGFVHKVSNDADSRFTGGPLGHDAMHKVILVPVSHDGIMTSIPYRH